MKENLKKQKRRLFAVIATALSILSVVMCTILSAVIYVDRQEWEYGYIVGQYDTYLRRMLTKYADEPNGIEYWINLANSSYNDIQIIVTDNETGKVYTKTRHCQRADITFEDTAKIGFIEYDHFRASMTDEQYNRICNYFSSENKAEGKGYILSYDEYYYQDSEVFPTKLQLYERQWSGQKTVKEILVEEFILNPNCGKNAVRGLNSEVNHQTIERKFFLGEYKKADLLSEIEGLKPIYSKELVDGPPIYYTGPFEMVVCYTQDDIEIKTKDGVRNLTGTYVQRINVLDECIIDIAIACVSTIILFAITGVILSAIIWKSFKKQMEQNTICIQE